MNVTVLPLLLCNVSFLLRLTAFVVRSFTKAQSFVFIDPKTIEGSVVWLKDKQQKNGCFEKSGKLFNNRMKVTEVLQEFVWK